MGLEGGSNFGGVPITFELRRSLEPLQRGLEARGEANPSWLSDLINPGKLAEYREFPGLGGHSDEWLILTVLLGKLVGTGPEMNPTTRARLHNLVGTLRMVSYPGMQESEQAYMRDLLASTPNDSNITYEITPETQEDIRWIWDTFSLRGNPVIEQTQLPSEQSSQTLSQFRPGSES